MLISKMIYYQDRRTALGSATLQNIKKQGISFCRPRPLRRSFSEASESGDPGGNSGNGFLMSVLRWNMSHLFPFRTEK